MSLSETGHLAAVGSTEDDRPLSERELEVLDLIVHGMTNRAAARRLGISERTVREHIARIFLKLRVASRVEAAVIATEWRMAREYGNAAASATPLGRVS
jgi:DNA-binding NarL/FixJ family response regulator